MESSLHTPTTNPHFNNTYQGSRWCPISLGVHQKREILVFCSHVCPSKLSIKCKDLWKDRQFYSHNPCFRNSMISLRAVAWKPLDGKYSVHWPLITAHRDVPRRCSEDCPLIASGGNGKDGQGLFWWQHSGWAKSTTWKLLSHFNSSSWCYWTIVTPSCSQFVPMQVSLSLG